MSGGTLRTAAEPSPTACERHARKGGDNGGVTAQKVVGRAKAAGSSPRAPARVRTAYIHTPKLENPS